MFSFCLISFLSNVSLQMQICVSVLNFKLMCVKQGIEEEDCSLVQLYIIFYVYCVLEIRALMLVEIHREIRKVHVCPAQSEVFRMSYLRISTPGMFTSLVPRPRPPCREKEGLIPCAAFAMSAHVCICMCVCVCALCKSAISAF